MKETLYTIQHADAFGQMQKTGVLRADERFLFARDLPDVLNAYGFMAEEMKMRICAPPAGVRYPVWAWHTWEGQRKRRDLRQGGYGARGAPMVQITFEAEEGSFLLSDFDRWHEVMRGTLLARDGAEYDRYRTHPTAYTDEMLRASWRRVFDLSYRSSELDTPWEDVSLQATLWEIRLSQVVRVEHFIAR